MNEIGDEIETPETKFLNQRKNGFKLLRTSLKNADQV